ncbi:hypothetical protein HPP92_006756 [Vanilla planifolia]|uniref:Uncharacterized protein n=1 Tax=Vanilla planifolia TaxID=51239 RepID=A0A835V8R7_VANPL|nr:hypothetical protein HPP92_006756 [Vanilla planifolia]
MMLFVADSAICSTQSCSKMDGEFTQSMLKSSGDAYAQTNSTTPSQPDRCDYYELGKAVLRKLMETLESRLFLMEKLLLTKPQSAAEISNKTGDTSADALSEDLKQLVGLMVDKKGAEHHCSVDKLNNDYCSALTFANHNKLHVPVESLQCIPKEPQNKPVKSDPGVLLDSSSATSNVVDKTFQKHS